MKELARLQEIQFNVSMAERGDNALEARAQALFAARSAILGAYLDEQETAAEAARPATPDDLEEAATYATLLLYERGGELFHPDDIAREIERRKGYRKEDDRTWQPESTADEGLVIDLVHRGAVLSSNDPTPAYGPHLEGRPFEVVDPSGTEYNKFGRILGRDDQTKRLGMN